MHPCTLSYYTLPCCRYVADGVVDFEPLRRRAEPKPPSGRPTGQPPDAAASATPSATSSSTLSDSPASPASPDHSHTAPHPPAHHHHHHLRDGHIHLSTPRHPPLHLHSSSNARPQESVSGSHAATHHQHQQHQHHAGGPSGPHSAPLPLLNGQRCRFVFLRGVQWSAPETNTVGRHGHVPQCTLWYGKPMCMPYT